MIGCENLKVQRPVLFYYVHTIYKERSTFPSRIEWMAANSHLEDNKKSDFNKDYSDLVVDDYYENAYSFLHDLNPDIRYGEPEYEGSHRKGYIGNSY